MLAGCDIIAQIYKGRRSAIFRALRDWQIWIAHGNRPYPCRYVITSTKVPGGPQYTIDVRAWKTGTEVASDQFSLQLPTDARKLTPGDLGDLDELPSIFAVKRGKKGQ